VSPLSGLLPSGLPPYVLHALPMPVFLISSPE
jgi:hypothetical protein